MERQDFFKELETLTALIANQSKYTDRVKLMQTSLQNFKQSFNIKNKSLQETIKAIDTAYNELQKLAQIMCLTSEGTKFHYWALGLNSRVQNSSEKGKFIIDYIKSLAQANPYNFNCSPKGNLINRVA